MLALHVDTHALIKRLQNAGFSESQAEVLTTSIQEVQESQIEKLATKEDIKDLRNEFKHEIHLLKWMVGILLGGVISLVAKAFFPF